jgi:hypothetical protein
MACVQFKDKFVAEELKGSQTIARRSIIFSLDKKLAVAHPITASFVYAQSAERQQVS